MRRHRAVLAALLVLLTACAGQLPVPPGPHDGHPYGGAIVVGVVSQPPGLLAGGITDEQPSVQWMVAPVMEGLLWYRGAQAAAAAQTQADDYAPALATEVPTVANGDVHTDGCTAAGARMCVTWKLRQGVLWHDGTPFTAHDVCATWQFRWLRWRQSNPTALASARGWDQSIACTERGRDQAVVSFRTEVGTYLALGSGVFGILPAHVLDDDFAALSGAGESLADHGVRVDLRQGSGNPNAFVGIASLDLMLDGTGPYVFQRYVSGSELDLVRNTRYWDTAHPPHLDRIVVRLFADTASLVAAATAHIVDMSLDDGLDALPRLRSAALHVQAGLEPGAETVVLNLCATAPALCGPAARHVPALADAVVRRALLLAVDRPGIVAAVAPGLTAVPHDAPLSLGAAYVSDAHVSQSAADPAAAGRLLDASGYHLDPFCDGGRTRSLHGACLEVEVRIPAGSEVRATERDIVARSLSAAGIRPILPPPDPADRLLGDYSVSGILATHRFDAAIVDRTATLVGEVDDWYPVYHGDCGGTCPTLDGITGSPGTAGTHNVGAVDDANLDLLFDLARQTADLSRRATLYTQAEEALAQDAVEVPLFQAVRVDTVPATLHGHVEDGLVPTFDAASWWCDAGRC